MLQVSKLDLTGQAIPRNQLKLPSPTSSPSSLLAAQSFPLPLLLSSFHSLRQRLRERVERSDRRRLVEQGIELPNLILLLQANWPSGSHRGYGKRGMLISASLVEN